MIRVSSCGHTNKFNKAELVEEYFIEISKPLI